MVLSKNSFANQQRIKSETLYTGQFDKGTESGLIKVNVNIHFARSNFWHPVSFIVFLNRNISDFLSNMSINPMSIMFRKNDNLFSSKFGHELRLTFSSQCLDFIE